MTDVREENLKSVKSLQGFPGGTKLMFQVKGDSDVGLEQGFTSSCITGHGKDYYIS